MTFNFPNFTWVDVHKDFDIKLDADFDLKWDIDVDIDKDKDIFIDIDTDVKLDDNVAELEGSIENDSFLGDLTVLAQTSTTDIKSQSVMDMDFTNVFQTTSIQAGAVADGFNTFTELTFAVEAYDTGSLTTVALISATD